MKILLSLLLCVVAFIAVGIVGAIDFKDEAEQQKTYCEKVKSGEWRDYKKTYSRACP